MDHTRINAPLRWQGRDFTHQTCFLAILVYSFEIHRLGVAQKLCEVARNENNLSKSAAQYAQVSDKDDKICKTYRLFQKLTVRAPEHAD
jgi:hypothetical protein